jgi:hypothetical protein
MLIPKFHLKYDDTLKTIQGVSENWRHKCYFVDYSKVESAPRTTFTQEQDRINDHSASTNQDVDRTLETGQNEIFAPQDEVVPIIRPPIRENKGVATIVPIQAPVPVQPTCRSTRRWKPTQRMIASIQQKVNNLTAAPYFDNDQLDIDIEDPITIMSHIEEDTMYWDEAMRQPNANKVLEAAIQEVNTP